MPQWTDVGGVNEGYVLDLYERFLRDPASVDAATRAAFEAGPPAFEGLAAEPARSRCRPGTLGRPRHCRRRQPGRVDPALRPPGRPARPARHAALGRPVARARGARHRETQTCAQLPATLVGGPVAERAANAAEAIAAPATGLLLPHRLRLRRTSSAAKSACGCATPSRPARSARPAIRSTKRRAARPHHRGRNVRALPAQVLPRQDAVLDRRRSTCSCPILDEIIADSAGSRREARADRDGASRPAEHARARAAEELRADPRRSSRKRSATSRSARTSAGPAT